MANSRALNLTIRVNDKQVDKTFNEMNAQFYKLINSTKKLKVGTQEWIDANKELVKVKKQRQEMIETQKQFQKELRQSMEAAEGNTSAIDEFSDSFSQAFNSARNGDLIGFRNGMRGITGSIRAATTASLKFIATPIGLAVAGLAGIAVAATAWFRYNEAALESLKTTKAITGLSDRAADQARVRAEALTETFGGDFKENLESADTLVKQFGISYDEAFDIIEDKLARGQKNNEEFFDSIKEYPTFFSQMRFSAQEFADVINAGYDLKIYKDKLPDAIKEADLALREQTKTTRDALVNAFGAPFTNSILERIDRGEITTKKALQEISAEADKSGLSIQQNAQLTADLFKGAGEDAGGALKVFEALNTALNDQKKPLSEGQQLLKDQAQATAELKQVSSELFFTGEKGFGLLIDKAKLFGTRTLVNLLKTGVDVVNWFVELNNKSGTFSGILATIGTVATAGFEIIDTLVENAKQEFSGLGDIVEGVFTLDSDRIKAGMAKMNQANVNFFKDLKDKAVEAKDEITSAFSGDNKWQKISLDSVISEGEGVDSQMPGGGKPKDEEESIDKEAQKRADKEKAIREKVAATLKEWEEERAIQDELEKIDKEQREEEEEILKLENEFAKLEEQAAGETELLARLEAEKKAQIQDVRDKYAEERLEKQKQEHEKLAKEEEEFKQRLMEAEMNLQDAKAFAYQTGIASLKGFFDNASGIYKILLALEKGFAINEIIVNASKAIAVAKANHAAVPPVIGVAPNPMYAVSAALTAKNILATKIAAGAQIASIAAETLKGFYFGGPTGNDKAPFRDKSGRNPVGFVHENEYVIPEFVRKDPEMPFIEGYIENKRRQKLGIGGTYNEGGGVGYDSEPSSSSSGMSSAKVEYYLEQLIELTATKEGKIFFGPEAEVERQKQEAKIKRIRNRSTIKKTNNP